MKSWKVIGERIFILLVFGLLVFESYQLGRLMRDNSKLRIQLYRTQAALVGAQKEVAWRRYNDSVRIAIRRTAKANQWLIDKEARFQSRSNEEIKQSPLRSIK